MQWVSAGHSHSWADCVWLLWASFSLTTIKGRRGDRRAQLRYHIKEVDEYSLIARMKYSLYFSF